MRVFETGGPISAVVDIPAGRVQVVASERADVTVEVVAVDADRGRDVKAVERTSVGFAEGVLRVVTDGSKNQYFGPSGSVDVTVALPVGSGVEVRAGAAEFRGVGRLGDVIVDGAYRRIQVDEAAGIRLTAVEGDVEVGRLGGSAEISTTRGDIRIAEAGRGTVVLRTDSGGISVAAAAGVSASLDAATAQGRISNSLKNDGVAELEIRATTSSGDIVARSL